MEPQEIKDQFKKRKTKQIILAAIVIPIMLGIVFFSEHGEVDLAGIPHEYIILGVVPLMIGMLIFSLINWRCPSCNKYLGKGINPKYCTKCGIELK